MRVFRETQRFDQWWLIAIMGFVMLVTLGSILLAIKEIEPNEMQTFLAVTIPAILVTLFITGGIFIVKLKTKIDDAGIHYGFWPFQKSLKTASWYDIKDVFVRKYQPITEFGGWGYKFSLKGHGKVYNTKGNMGIQIVFKDGKKTLVGTQQPEEVKLVISKYISKEKLS